MYAGPADADHPLQPTIAWLEENAVAVASMPIQMAVGDG